MSKHDLVCLTCSVVLGTVERPLPPSDSGILCEACSAEMAVLSLDLQDGVAENQSLFQKFTSYLSRLLGR